MAAPVRPSRHAAMEKCMDRSLFKIGRLPSAPLFKISATAAPEREAPSRTGGSGTRAGPSSIKLGRPRVQHIGQTRSNELNRLVNLVKRAHQITHIRSTLHHSHHSPVSSAPRLVTHTPMHPCATRTAQLLVMWQAALPAHTGSWGRAVVVFALKHEEKAWGRCETKTTDFSLRTECRRDGCLHTNTPRFKAPTPLRVSNTSPTSPSIQPITNPTDSNQPPKPTRSIPFRPLRLSQSNSSGIK